MRKFQAGMMFPSQEIDTGARNMMSQGKSPPRPDALPSAYQQIGLLLFLMSALFFCTLGGDLIHRLLLILWHAPEL
jgi:hypothetical protein